jgi:hypothetical protein
MRLAILYASALCTDNAGNTFTIDPANKYCLRATPSYSSFGNGVDPKFIGIPPFPQKKAERMGHGSLQQKQKCSSHKNKDVARMGHPNIVGIYLPKQYEVE